MRAVSNWFTPFTISNGGTTELVLDFDAQRSVHRAGNKYILKPTIKVIDTTVSSATVSGSVTSVSGDETVAMEGVTVSVQYYNEDDKLIIQSSTITDEEGNYRMILPEDIPYHIVAYTDGYAPSCIADVVLGAGDNLTDQDFILAAADTGTVSGTVYIDNGAEDDSAVLSFRQDCSGAVIEVKAVNVGYDAEAENGTFSGVILSVGTYAGIASSDIADPEKAERDDQKITVVDSADIVVTAGADTVLDDITFTD